VGAPLIGSSCFSEQHGSACDVDATPRDPTRAGLAPPHARAIAGITHYRPASSPSWYLSAPHRLHRIYAPHLPCVPSLKLSALCALPIRVRLEINEPRKHWRQLSDFHSLTDLKIAVSSHREPQITAGLRSVCWKVPTAPLPPRRPELTMRRYSCSSKLSTARHGPPASPSLAQPTPLFAPTT
jgi:hypothetical protein